MAYLVHNLHGAMASWGIQETAPTFGKGRLHPTVTHPTKSGLAGLYGAALGVNFRKNDPHPMWVKPWGLMTQSVYEQKVEDYQTHGSNIVSLKGGMKDRLAKASQFILPDLYGKLDLSNREYLTGFHAVVLVQHNDLGLLQRIQEGLEAPVFPLYLGRSNCLAGGDMSPVIMSDFQEAEEMLTFRMEEIRKDRRWLRRRVECTADLHLVPATWGDKKYLQDSPMPVRRAIDLDRGRPLGMFEHREFRWKVA
jgi:CRISPR-associated Cas5-like protein